jgi:hypothetical protein
LRSKKKQGKNNEATRLKHLRDQKTDGPSAPPACHNQVKGVGALAGPRKVPPEIGNAFFAEVNFC